MSLILGRLSWPVESLCTRSHEVPPSGQGEPCAQARDWQGGVQRLLAPHLCAFSGARSAQQKGWHGAWALCSEKQNQVGTQLF